MVLIIHVLCACGQQTQLAFEAGIQTGNWKLIGHVSQYESKFRIGILTGGNTDIPVVPGMTLQSEVQYARFSSVQSSEHQHATYNANYLVLPVMARYDLDNGLSFMAGPQIGLLLGAGTSTDREVTNMTAGLRKMDLFIRIGAQHRPINRFTIGIWYQHGLMDTDKGAHLPLQNRGLGLEITYKAGSGLRTLINNLFSRTEKGVKNPMSR